MRNTGNSNSADNQIPAKNWNSTWIDRVRVTVVELRLSSEDARARARGSGERIRWVDLLPRNKICGESAAAIGVFDAIKISGRGVVDSGRKVDAADEANGAGREGRLVITEVGGGTGKSDGEVVDINGRSKIPNIFGGAGNYTRLVVDSKDVAAAIDDSDGHGAAVDGHSGILHDSLHFGLSEWSVSRRRRILFDRGGRTAAAEEKNSNGSGKYERNKNAEPHGFAALEVSAVGFDRFSNERSHGKNVGRHATHREKEITWIVPLLQRSGDS